MDAAAPPPLDAAVVQRLVDWLAAEGVAFAGCRVEHVPGMGLGLVARRALRVGELVLSVPRALWLERTSVRTPYGPVVAHARRERLFLGQMSGLALLLLLESGNARSAFRPYLDALGPAPMPFEIGRDPDAPPQSRLLAGWIEAQARQTAEECFVLSQTLPAAFPDLVPPGSIDLDRWRWAYGHAVGRGFPVVLDGAPAWALVPGMDLCNHARGVRNGYYAESLAWRLEATQAWPAGAQVTIHYGREKSSADFFLHYGFVPPDNPNDRVLLRLLGTPDERGRARVRGTCPLGIDGALPRALLARLAGVDEAALDGGREAQARAWIARSIERHQAALPTTLTGDLASLAQTAPGTARHAVLAYRVAMKRVLAGARRSVERRAEGIRRRRTPPAREPAPAEPHHALTAVDVPPMPAAR